MATTLDIVLVETYSSASIAFGDISVYSPLPTNPSFEITLPGYPKKNVAFVPSAVNIFNFASLEIGSEDPTAPLPDGVYTVTYSVFPNSVNTVTKQFMRTKQIDGKIKRLYLAVDNDCPCGTEYKKKTKQLILNVQLLVDGSIAATEDCDVEEAYQMYNKANQMLDRVNLCECN